MAAPEPPLGPRRLDFTALTDDDFELLCYLVVLIEFPDAVRLRAPDLGADSALPTNGSGYTRCWQTKRFTEHVKWGHCRDSLDAAVPAYQMARYTFCFARDLTGSQHKLFRKHLVGLHDGVTVDYWGASRLVRALLASPQGERIANHFYGDPTHDARALMHALRADGPLETGADATDRLRAVGEWLAGHDPFFAYTASVREAHIPSPGATPGAVVVFEEVGPETAERLEAVPRNAEAVERFGPEFAVLFESSDEGRAALQRFQRALETGEEVTVEQGVAIQFKRMPPLLQSRVPEEPLEDVSITFGPSEPGRPTRWPAHLVAHSDRGQGVIDIDLEPVDPPSGWDGALEGSRGGLTVILLFRRTEDHGEAKLTFNFAYDSTLPVVDLLAATATLVALHGRGVLEIEARDGSRPNLQFDLVDQSLHPFVNALLQLLEGVRLIEEWSGRTLTLAPSISREEMWAISQVSYVLRNGHSNMNVEQVTLEFDQASYEAFQSRPLGPMRLGLPLRLNLFDEELSLGYLVGEVSDIRIASATPIAGAEPQAWSVRLEPASEEARRPVFRLQRDHPASEGAAAP